MMPDITVVGGAIDVWCHVLNYEERLRNPDKVSRLFCNTSMVNEEMLTEFDVSGRMFKIFSDNLKNVIRHSVFRCIGDIDMVFFPILQENHYYVICYNLITSSLHIIDNMASADVDMVARYGKLPIVLTSLFATYLASVQHPRARKLMNPFTKVLKMSWQTKMNFVDCGVFVMRHMETYKGDASSGGFKTGFVKEGKDQKKQLGELRVKYLTKMLLCELNMKKSNVIEECEKYQKLPSFEKMKLKADAAVRIEGRVSRMIKPAAE